jgi:exopolysaccharide production protein ExoQ
MSNTFIFKGLALFTLCLFFIFDNIRLDLVLTGIDPEDRFPFHRFYIAFTIFLFFANSRVVANECLKNKAMLILWAYIFISMVWSSVPYASFKTFFSQLLIMLVSIMAVLAYYERRIVLIKTLYVCFFIFVAASVAIVWLFPGVGVDIVNFGRPRWIGVSDHPNELGVTALVLIWLSMNYFYMGTSKKWTVLAITMAYYVIVMADSITSLVTALAVMFYVFYRYKISKLHFIFKMFLFLLVFLFFVAIIGFYKSFPDLISSLLEAGGRNSTLTGRTKLWNKAVLSLRGHWLFGYGFDNLKQVTQRQYKQMYQMSHLHNGYLEVLLKGGILGWILLGVVIVKTIYYQFKIRKRHRAEFVFLSSGFVMIFIHNFAQSSLLKGNITLSVLFVFIAIMSSLIYHRDQYEDLAMRSGL